MMIEQGSEMWNCSFFFALSSTVLSCLTVIRYVCVFLCSSIVVDGVLILLERME